MIYDILYYTYYLLHYFIVFYVVFYQYIDFLKFFFFPVLEVTSKVKNLYVYHFLAMYFPSGVVYKVCKEFNKYIK